MLPKNRSNSVKKIKRKIPSKKISIIYRRKSKQKQKIHRSPISQKRLPAVSSLPTLAKSHKRPNRPYGGQLLASESRRVIKYKALLESNQITLDQIPSKYHKFLKTNNNSNKK